MFSAEVPFIFVRHFCSPARGLLMKGSIFFFILPWRLKCCSAWYMKVLMAASRPGGMLES
jgi:hypothetical protein